MPRNRRNQSAAIRFGPALKAFALCLVIGGSAVGYVWQKDQIRQLGDRISEGEQALRALRLKNETLRRDLATLRSAPNLERLARERNLGLVQTPPNQVVRLPEPGPLPGAGEDAAAPRRYAVRRWETVWTR